MVVANPAKNAVRLIICIYISAYVLVVLILALLAS